MTVGPFEYGQGGTYQAADDRRMITALAAGRSPGVVTPVALTAGAGLNVVVAAGWLAVASAGDGTLGVLGSSSSITVTANAGDPGAARTDALWADVSPTSGQFTLSVMPQSSTPGRIGLQLATLTVPANANLASAITLTPVAATFLAPVAGPWRDLRSSMAGGFSHPGAGNLPLQTRLGSDGMVDVAGWVRTPTGTVNVNAVTFAVAPADCRPAAGLVAAWTVTGIPIASAAAPIKCQIDSSGNMSLNFAAGTVAQTNFSCYGRFPSSTCPTINS